MREFKSGCFFLFCSLFVVWESLRLGLGTWHKPGSGFLSFWGGIGAIFFSLNLIRKGWGIREAQIAHSTRVVVAVISTICYSLVLEPLGFVISTFMLLGIFFHLGEPRRWWLLIGMSGFVTLLIYLLFGILLQVHLPKGIVGI